MENKATETKTEQRRPSFKELPKKKKTTIIVGIVLAAVLVIGAVLTGVLVPLYANRAQGNVQFTYRAYHYAVDLDKGDRLRLPTDWITSGELSAFGAPTNTYPENVKVENGYVRLLSMPQTLTGEDVSEFTVVLEYKVGTSKAATINVTFLRGVHHITTLKELAAIDGAVGGNYMLDANLDFGDTPFHIERFAGRLFGNHRTLSNLVISSAIGSRGGLFGYLERATIVGLNLTVADRSQYSSSDLTVGALADSAYRSHISYCSVSGALLLTPMSGENRIGGIVGYLYEDERAIYADIEEATMDNCTSTLALTIRNAGGRLSFGGLVGLATNVKLVRCTAAGKLDVRISGSQLTYFAYVGGVVGQWNRSYKRPLRINAYDTSPALVCNGDVNVYVTNTGVGNNVFVGGVAGRITNQQLQNASYGGNMQITSEGIPLIVGGIAGEAINDYAASDMVLSFLSSGVTKSGEITITTQGWVWAGGVCGRQISCSISAEEKHNIAYLPTVNGEHSDNKTGEYYGWGA